MKLFTPTRETWMYRVNPACKLLVCISSFLVLLFTHRLDFALYQCVVYMGLLFGTSGYSFKRMLLFTLPFIAVFVSSSMTMILFGKGDTLWWSWGLLRITEESFYRGIHIGFKSLSCAASGLLFALTTKPTLLFYALMQRLRVPPKYAYSFMASFRLLPMIWEEIQIRKQALAVRGVKTGSGLRGWIQRLHHYAVPMLARSIRRAQRIAVAMEAKRFSMKQRARTYYYPTSLSQWDVRLIILLSALIAAAYMASLWMPMLGVGDVRG